MGNMGLLSVAILVRSRGNTMDMGRVQQEQSDTGAIALAVLRRGRRSAYHHDQKLEPLYSRITSPPKCALLRDYQCFDLRSIPLDPNPRVRVDHPRALLIQALHDMVLEFVFAHLWNTTNRV